MYDVCDVPASMWTIYLGKKKHLRYLGCTTHQTHPSRRVVTVLCREVLKQRPRSGQGLPGRGQKWGVLQLIAVEKGK